MRSISSPTIRWTALAAVVSSACDARAPGPEVTLWDSSGVEIAAPRQLPPLLSERHRWRLELLRSIELEPRPGEPPLLYQPTRALPLSDGSLLIADASGDMVLHVLDVERSVVTRSFARRGEGPGEVGGYPTLHEDVDGRIHVGDPGNRKLVVFSREGTVLEEAPLRGTASQWQFHAGGKLLANRYLHQGPDGFSTELVEVDPLTAGTTHFAPLPAPPPGTPAGRIQPGRPLWVALTAGVVTATSDVPVFRIHDQRGRVVREVRLPLTRRSLDDGEIARLRARVGGLAASFQPGPIAITNALHPFGDTAFAMFQSQLWRAAEDPLIEGDERVWRLVSVHGKPMGSLVWPEDVTPNPLWTGQGVLWTTAFDEGGHPLLQKLALEPP